MELGITIFPTDRTLGWIPMGRGDVASEAAAVRRALEDAGRDHAVFPVESDQPDRVIERLDELQAVVAAHRS